ncbi:hypothetical protein [Acinetobacter entericus]|uniref:DNA transfer protein n=1 Tax=Acinetobacter entericus TaxID=2989714 RepID=A0ABT3NEI5_9GAMM|nr:hypothetical protein [Acinetobacter entericus]MCW8037956.1 hypothetical protein [Acinetobacter entericus]
MSFGLRNKGTKDAGVYDSGRIKGAGTGTSDDVKKEVPSGSYIMPADSTAQIGEQSLQRLGKPTPVNLSNGEFQLTPDQVHQVGVHALNQMKEQTHTPVNQPQVQQNAQGEPELFFANGGLIQSPYPNADDIRRAQQQRLGPNIRDVSGITRDVSRQLPSTNVAAPETAAASSQAAKPGFGARMASGAKGLGVLHGVASMFGGATQGYNTSTEDYATRMGLDPNVERSGAANLGIRAAGVMSDVGNAASFGILGKRFGDKQVQQAQADYEAQQARFADWNKQKAAGTPNAVAQTASQPTQAVKPAAAPIEQQMNNAVWGDEKSSTTPKVNQPQADPYSIQQKGNGFSYANPAAAAQARLQGVPELQGSGVVGGIRRANDPSGVDNLMRNTAEFGPTDQQVSQAFNAMNSTQNIQYPNRPQRSQEQDLEREQVMRDIRAPIDGARGMTSSQRSQLLEMQTGDDNRAVQMYNTDANNATSQFNNAANNSSNMAQTMVREQGANQRAVLGETGQNYRQGQALNQDTAKYNAEFGLKNRQQNLTEQKEGFGIRQAQRVEKLQEMYDKAETEEQRQSIQARINRLSGAKENNGRDRYMTVGGGQEWDEIAGTMVNRPQQIFDTQTKEYVDSIQQPQTNQPSQNHIAALKNNPQQAAQFDAIYGKGASSRYL